MKTAEYFLKEAYKKIEGRQLVDAEVDKILLHAMEEHAQQFKYDFSKTCECENSPGETMCCNNCGLPTTTASRQRVTRNILKDFFDFIFTSDGVKTSPAHREKKIDEYLSSHASQFQSAPLPDISDEDEGAICEIDFGGSFKCQIEIKNNDIKILNAMDGYGNLVDPSEIQIHH